MFLINTFYKSKQSKPIDNFHLYFAFLGQTQDVLSERDKREISPRSNSPEIPIGQFKDRT